MTDVEHISRKGTSVPIKYSAGEMMPFGVSWPLRTRAMVSSLCQLQRDRAATIADGAKSYPEVARF
jgi:hypothetical protein